MTNGGIMGQYRIYPDKSNTLIEGKQINTGKNGVMELWYGRDGIARHLVDFDFTTYNELYALGEVPHITAATSTFNMTNCYPIFEKDPYNDATAAINADIEIKVIQQPWDTGLGHDFYGNNTVNGTSNWYSATTTSNWASLGGDFAYTVFSGNVALGNSNIKINVDNEIELWNAFTGSSHGFGVKFTDPFENLSGDVKTILAYFTQNSRTAHLRPYIEILWTDPVGPSGATTISGSGGYFVTVPDLKRSYMSDEIVDLNINVYENYTSTLIVSDNIEYKIVLKDGIVDYAMVDWISLPHTATANVVRLNFNWLLPNERYEIELRYVVDGVTTNHIDGPFKFKVIEG